MLAAWLLLMKGSVSWSWLVTYSGYCHLGNWGKLSSLSVGVVTLQNALKRCNKLLFTSCSKRHGRVDVFHSFMNSWYNKAFPTQNCRITHALIWLNWSHDDVGAYCILSWICFLLGCIYLHYSMATTHDFSRWKLYAVNILKKLSFRENQQIKQLYTTLINGLRNCFKGFVSQVEVFWVVTPCGVIGYRRFRVPYFFLGWEKTA